MSSEGYDFPIKELHESLKRYFDAKIRSDLYQEKMCDEAENLFSYFTKYAKKERNEGTYNFSKIIENFYSEILNMTCDSQDKAIRTSLTKRFMKLMKQHITEDPRYQVKLDEFIS